MLFLDKLKPKVLMLLLLLRRNPEKMRFMTPADDGENFILAFELYDVDRVKDKSNGAFKSATQKK